MYIATDCVGLMILLTHPLIIHFTNSLSNLRVCLGLLPSVALYMQCVFMVQWLTGKLISME